MNNKKYTFLKAVAVLSFVTSIGAYTQTSVSANTVNTTVVSNEVTKVETEIKAIEKTIADLDTKIVSLNSTHATNTSETNSLTNELNTLKQKLSSKQGELSTLQAELQKANTSTVQPEVLFSNNNDNVRFMNKTSAAEQVIYSGEKEEVIQVPEHVYQQMKSPEGYTHVPNQENLAKELHKVITELRELNGISTPVPQIHSEAMQYAQARANEMLANNKMSHNTVYTNVTGYENINNYSFAENSKSTSPFLVLSDKELAYNIALGWFSEYNNVSQTNLYGHRYTLLYAAADKFGVAISANTSDGRNFSSLNLTGLNYTQYQEYMGHIQKTQETPNGVYYNGRRQVFLPKTTFKYVYTPNKPTVNTSQINTNITKTQNEISALKNEIAKREERVKALHTTITNLNTQKKNLETQKSNAVAQKTTLVKKLEEIKAKANTTATTTQPKVETRTSKVITYKEQTRTFYSDKMFVGQKRTIKLANGTTVIYIGTKPRTKK